jgi:hypothetical protein
MLFETVSSAHLEDVRDVLELGFDSAVYIKPVHAGDTLRKEFVIKSLHATPSGSHTIVEIHCQTFNQNKQLVFVVDKHMIYQRMSNPNRIIRASHHRTVPASPLREHLITAGANLQRTPHAFAIQPGQLVLHASARPIGYASNMQLSTLFKMTHPLIFSSNLRNQEAIVPGPLVIALTLSAASREMYEILHETIDKSRIFQRVGPLDTVGAVSYIKNVQPLQNDLEEVTLSTIGIKNCAVRTDLKGVPIPVALFSEDLKERKEVSELLKKECPILENKIVCKVDRRIVRSVSRESLSQPLL